MNTRKNLLIVLMLTTWFTSGNMVWADDCDEAGKWFNEGIALSDNSEREAYYYQKAIELCPDYYEAHNKLGEVYKGLGAYELAIKEFEQACRSPSFAEPHNGLGEIYRMQGRYDLAAEEFAQAIMINPDFRKAHNHLKYVNKRLGKYDFIIEEPTEEPTPTANFTRIPGLTLPEGQFMVDFSYRYWNQKSGLTFGDPDSVGIGQRETTLYASILGIRYGLTNNLTIGLIPKYFSKTAHIEVPSFAVDADPEVTGLGDTVFLTKYRLWGRRRTHFSVFNLLSIPTGDEDALGENDGVIRRIPLGSGSYDFTPGISFTTMTEPLTIHASLWYVITDGRTAGDEFHCDLALLLPPYHNLVALMELNYRWADTAEHPQFIQRRFGFLPLEGQKAPAGGPEYLETTVYEKGGHTLLFSPGVQFNLTKGLKAEFGVQLPIIRPDDGWSEEIVFHVGLTKYFF